MPIRLSDVISSVAEGSIHVDATDDVEYCDVVVDSRTAQPGSLFVALAGENTNGHSYVEDAFERGALGALVERPIGETRMIQPDLGGTGGSARGAALTPPLCIMVPNTLVGLQRMAASWRRRFPACRVVGITGSVGKTSAKELIASVLSQRYCTLRSEGNYNNEIGLPLTLLRMRREHERAVLEMGMYDLGEISLLAEIAGPSIGVVTNVGPTHLERLGSIDRISQAKAELIEALPADGVAILNGDDHRVRAMSTVARGCRVLTYGLGPGVDVRATDVRALGLRGVSFRVHHREHALSAHTALLGEHSVRTALAAVAVGIAEGMAWEQILPGLADPAAVIRLRPLRGVHGSTLLDDSYNASPASSLAALALLKELGQRRIAVLGDMLELGSFEEEGHRLVGQRAAEVASLLYVVGSRAKVIAEEALRCGMPAKMVHVMDSDSAVVSALVDELRPGDVVLVKASRGIAMESIVSALQCGDDLEEEEEA